MATRARDGFTLVELLVVIAIVSLLIGLLLPALGSSRRAAQRVACLANVRSIETAHWIYMSEHDGWMIGTSHGASWMDTLRAYDPSILLRSPADTSPHFEGGVPINGRYRLTSYAINYNVSPDNPGGIARLDMVPRPVATAHLVIKAYESNTGGDQPVRDHVHPALWHSPIRDRIPAKAALEMRLHAHAGEAASWTGVSNYGFLDGHAESRTFSAVYSSRTDNSFDPAFAK